MSSYLFVYGTLMQKHDNELSNMLRKNCTLIGNGFIHAEKYNLGDYPGIKIDPQEKQKTKGELYLINENKATLLEALDYYEGFIPSNPSESLFIRKQVQVFLVNKNYVAWVYEYNKMVDG